MGPNSHYVLLHSGITWEHVHMSLSKYIAILAPVTLTVIPLKRDAKLMFSPSEDYLVSQSSTVSFL